ncbi:hypothetical protein [Carboxylicivirga sp. M1479]|uniref:hypothetical protein n=1 Tax=Carboxylicivirga sp. M1479 TaxID=2594476 RepID=UPI0011774378|nr:hypothetical protein [Carboxylicivirga sp. M1479]TRX66184.1 hypothetical protein FNN09_14805 [Carboxylicivirga sp. M1479]
MHNIYKVVVTFLFVAFIAISAASQNRTYSPYSRYGIGELQEGGFGRNAAMGNTGIALSSSYNLNNINPASYFSMDSISFFFEAGLTGFDQKIQTNEMTAQFSDMNFSYFAIGFPVAKWGFMSVGVKPESLVGYQFFDDNESSSLPITDGNYTKSLYSGSGNTTKAYTGIALSPIKNLSFGAHFSFVFGKVEHYSLGQFPNDPYAFDLGTSQHISINDFYMDFGVQYRLDLKERHNLVFGAIYQPKRGMNGKVKKLVAAGTTLDSNGMTVIAADTLSYSETEFSGGALELPEKYGFGLAYNIDELLTITADYSLSKWSEAEFPNLATTSSDINAFTIGDEQTFAFGVEYVPNYRSASFYPSRIKYRLGTSYKQDYLIAPQSQGGDHLTDFGITFGMGLPLKRSKTSFNLAFEWGQRGSTNNNLVKEEYLRFTMNLTLHEYWFMKRKFD